MHVFIADHIVLSWATQMLTIVTVFIAVGRREQEGEEERSPPADQ